MMYFYRATHCNARTVSLQEAIWRALKAPPAGFGAELRPPKGFTLLSVPAWPDTVEMLILLSVLIFRIVFAAYTDDFLLLVKMIRQMDMM